MKHTKKLRLRSWVKVVIGLTCWVIAILMFMNMFADATNEADTRYQSSWQAQEVVRNK